MLVKSFVSGEILRRRNILRMKFELSKSSVEEKFADDEVFISESFCWREVCADEKVVSEIIYG